MGMAAGLGGFLFLADPSGGSATEATAGHWILAAIATTVTAVIFVLLAVTRFRRGKEPSPSRKAALLAVSAAVAWGFVAAVIKELSTHISAGPSAVFTNWSPYVLVASGAIAVYLASNAFQAGPLAASQPGLTIVDPLVASLLGVTLFGEQIRHGPLELAGEAVAVVVLVASVVLLSRSPLVTGHPAPDGRSLDPGAPREAVSLDAATPPAGDAAPAGDASAGGRQATSSGNDRPASASLTVR